MTAKQLIKSIKKKRGGSYAGIERALQLPQGTLRKWVSGQTKPSKAGIALLQFIDACPWLVDVADENFNFDSAMKIMIVDSLKHVKFVNGREDEK